MGTALAVVMTVVVLSMDQGEAELPEAFPEGLGSDRTWETQQGGSRGLCVRCAPCVVCRSFSQEIQEIPGEGLAEPPLRQVTKPRCWPDLPSVPAVSW